MQIGFVVLIHASPHQAMPCSSVIISSLGRPSDIQLFLFPVSRQSTVLLQMLLMTTLAQAAYSLAPSYIGVLRQLQYCLHVFESRSAPGTKHVAIDLHFVHEHVALGAVRFHAPTR
jgi:hypothetical protein